MEREVELNAQDPDSRATLAPLYAKNGDKSRALENIKISLAMAPNSQYVLSQVADAYELLGKRKEAIAFLQRAISQA